MLFIIQLLFFRQSIGRSTAGRLYKDNDNEKKTIQNMYCGIKTDTVYI